MPEYLDLIILVIAGALGGFLSGLLGIGGGVIFIPFLDYFFYKLGYYDNELVRVILANSLFIIIFTGLISSYKHYKLNNFHPKAIIYTVIPAIISSSVFTYLVKKYEFYDEKVFSIVFISLMIYIFIKMVNVKKKDEEQIIEATEGKPTKFGIVGFLTGLVSAMSGLGGGAVMIPMFTRYMKLSIKVANSISVGTMPLFVLPIAIVYFNYKPEIETDSIWQFGYMNFAITLPMVLGVIFLAPLGVKTSQKVSERTLSIIFAIVVLVNIIKMVFKLIP